MESLIYEISIGYPEPETTDPSEQDLLPEYTRYKDEGCEYAKACLECPFPQCLYDEPGGRKRWLKEMRNTEINRLFNTGKSTSEIAMQFDVSEKTVKRALQGNKK